MTENGSLVAALEALAGVRRIVACPWFCDAGWRGCDACNRCGRTGTGFYLGGTFYPNTERGWRDALAAAKARA